MLEDMEEGRGPCLYRVDCGLRDGGGGHCEEGGRELEVRCACGEGCEEDQQGDDSLTSWGRCRSEPWNGDG